MKKGILIAILSLFMGASSAFAQAFYPTEKNAFYDQLAAYLGTAASKQERDDAAVMMKAFRGAWDSYYSDAEINTVMRLCELFHSKGGTRAYPNTFNFVAALQKVPTAGLTHKDVNNWLTFTEAKAQKSMNGIDKYLKSCRDLFVDKVLSVKGNSKWLVRDALIGFPKADKFELVVDGTLVLATQNDESVIKQTKGVYSMEDNSWKGQGGRADWSRFGISAESVFVTFPDFYTIDLNRSEYAIDSVLFNERNHFNQQILCRFEDKVQVNAPNERTMYPRVKSYRSDYRIPNILRNVDFEGGIGMMGNLVEVFGGVNNKAMFHFHRNGTEVVKVESGRFTMSEDELLVSDRAMMRLYLPDTVAGRMSLDSIYHNGLGFRYDNKSRRLIVYRSEKDFGDAPFHDYYHGVDIFLEAMYWDIDESVVDFRRMEGVNHRSEGDVVSVNYFRNDDFKRLQGLDGTHPMIRVEKFLKGFSNVDRQVHFYLGDLTSYLGYPTEQVISLVLRLQAEGYMEYDAQTQWVTALPRFFDMVDSYNEVIDYDVIKLHTVTTNRQPNMRLDLGTNDLLVFGITSQIDGYEGPAISLSDRKHVVIVPDNGRITLKKNKNFKFSGGILAGMFEFFTKDCLFLYDEFTIRMPKVDSLRFYARDNREIIPVDGTLERLKGRLFIDKGDNKSSREDTPEYPIFQSDAEGYKFYRKINGGAFNPGSLDSLKTSDDFSGKFYYSLYPFVVDSLNDLTMKKVRFDGELVSGGILPNIVEPLVVMDDYSLGFEHQIGNGDTDSYPMYDGSGQLHETVHLSSSGFYGIGKLDYQTSQFTSDKFMLYPKLVTAITKDFKMEPLADGTGFPIASADALKLRWDVFKPELTTETIKAPICMYGDTYFKGKTTLSPDGYSADGKLRFGLTEFDSDHFAFDSRTFVADSAKFMLYSADSSSVAFAATNYRANVDFDAQKVKYDYLDNTSNLDFPMNQYICSLKEAEWDMATNSLHLDNPIETFGDYATATTHEELLAVHNNASKFISLVPGQDSLNFYSMNAEYDMTNYIIHAHDVKIIRVADAAVFPYDHDVDINAESKLDPVAGDLLADTLNRFHLYKNAVVDIQSRKKYYAQGYWDYEAADGTRTPIFMDSIAPRDGVTRGVAHLADTSALQLSPQFAFKGKVTLTATDEHGLYDGHFALSGFNPDEAVAFEVISEDSLVPIERLPSDTLEALHNWFVSTATIDPKDIQVPIDLPHIQEETPEICSGLYYEQAIDGGYFASFLTPKKGRREKVEVNPSNGTLWYDAVKNRFVVSEEQTYDSWLSLNSRGIVEGQVSSDLGFDMALVDFAVHGNYTQYPNDTLTFSGLNVLNVPVFDDDVMAGIAEVYANMEGSSIDLTKTQYMHYFRSENDEEKVAERAMAIELEGYPQMESSSDFYNKTLVIPDLKMVWNDKMHAFVSVGKIGLGNLGKHVVNKYVDGYVVFDHRLGNVTYFFQNDMFLTFINYNCGDGQLQVHATYSDLNQKMYDTKDKARTRKKGDKRFEYVAVPYESMLDFLNRLKNAGFVVSGI